MTSPPVDGEANAAVIDILSRSLSVPKSAIEIIRGTTGRRKTIRIHGTTMAAVTALGDGWSWQESQHVLGSLGSIRLRVLVDGKNPLIDAGRTQTCELAGDNCRCKLAAFPSPTPLAGIADGTLYTSARHAPAPSPGITALPPSPPPAVQRCSHQCGSRSRR